MEKKYIVLLVLVCGILGGGFFAIRGTMDRVAPEIQIPEVQAEYHWNDTEEMLLKDVTAKDDRDGDVTASLMVENVFTDDAKGVAVVVYVAKDSSNNVTKATRNLSWDPQEVQTEVQTELQSKLQVETEPEKVTEAPETEAESETGSRTESEAVSVTEGETESELAVETEAVTEEPESETQTAAEEAVALSGTEEDLDAYYEEVFAGLAPGVPRLRLTDRKLTVSVGDSFDPLLYVYSIEDDYDNKYELWRHISIDGEVNTKVPGIYQLIYTATDSSGNTSNRAMLLVDVQGEYGEEE